MALSHQLTRESKSRSRKPKPVTPGVGHNAGLDAEQVKSFFDRWTRLENEKQATSDDLKELFAEAKGVRLSPKAMRAAFRYRRRKDQGKTPSESEQAEVELYLSALEALGKFVALPSHAREATPEKPEIGAVATYLLADRATASAGQAADESPAPIQGLSQEPHAEADRDRGVSEAGRAEGSAARLPSGRAENKPDGPAVTAAVPTHPNPEVAAASEEAMLREGVTQ